MALNKIQKKDQVQDIKNKLERAQAVIFTKNNGLTVEAFKKMRKSLRENNIDCKVAKKTLFRIAAKENGIDEIPDEVLEGPIVTIFGYDDQIVTARIVAQCVKSSAEKLELTGGVLEKQVINKERVKYLANLPSKEQLIIKFLWTCNTPVTRFVGTLSGINAAFVRVLNAYKEKLEKNQ